MYRVSASVNDLEVLEVLLTPSFQLQPDKILETAGPDTKILFLCSPGNPTAAHLKHSDMMKLIARFPGIVVVDEAYIDFSRHESMAAFVGQYAILVVHQTLSKPFGLAGLRLGVVMPMPVV